MILVTGAGGFIGRQVCQRLSASGHAVVAVDQHFGMLHPTPTVQGDLTSYDFRLTIFQKYAFDTIVHLAAILNTASGQHPDQAMQLNIGASLHLLQLAQQFQVAKFLFGSSISAYGPKPYAVSGEVSEAEPACPTTIYGVSKRYVEIVGAHYRQQGQLQFVALRISMVVGAGAANTASRWRSEIFEKLQTRARTLIHLPYSSHERLPLIHVVDVAEVIRRLSEAERTEHWLYNTPSANWQGSDLAAYVRSLNPNVELAFSPSTSRGDPEAITGRRFTEEFDFRSISLEERLRRAAESGEG